MSSVLSLSLLVAVLLFVGRPCLAPGPSALDGRIPGNGIWFQEVTETSESLVGVAGSSFQLLCDITAPTADDSVALVLWYKNRDVTPFYTLDARRRGPSQAKHATDPSFSGRAYVHIYRQLAILRLTLLLEDDEGQYRCRVDFRKARSRYVHFILTVIVPPKEPVIMDQDGEVVHNMTVPYNSDRVYLLCKTEGGTPMPSLTWWMESELLDDSYEVSDDGVVKNEIVINGLQPGVLLAVLTCQATNNNITAPVSNYVTLDMNYSAFVPSSGEMENIMSGGSIAKDIIKEVTPIAQKYGYLEVVEAFCPNGSRETSAADSYYKPQIENSRSTDTLGKNKAEFPDGK